MKFTCSCCRQNISERLWNKMLIFAQRRLPAIVEVRAKMCLSSRAAAFRCRQSWFEAGFMRALGKDVTCFRTDAVVVEVLALLHPTLFPFIDLPNGNVVQGTATQGCVHVPFVVVAAVTDEEQTDLFCKISQKNMADVDCPKILKSWQDLVLFSVSNRKLHRQRMCACCWIVWLRISAAGWCSKTKPNHLHVHVLESVNAEFSWERTPTDMRLCLLAPRITFWNTPYGFLLFLFFWAREEFAAEMAFDGVVAQAIFHKWTEILLMSAASCCFARDCLLSSRDWHACSVHRWGNDLFFFVLLLPHFHKSVLFRFIYIVLSGGHLELRQSTRYLLTMASNLTSDISGSETNFNFWAECDSICAELIEKLKRENPNKLMQAEVTHLDTGDIRIKLKIFSKLNRDVVLVRSTFFVRGYESYKEFRQFMESIERFMLPWHFWSVNFRTTFWTMSEGFGVARHLCSNPKFRTRLTVQCVIFAVNDSKPSFFVHSSTLVWQAHMSSWDNVSAFRTRRSTSCHPPWTVPGFHLFWRTTERLSLSSDLAQHKKSGNKQNRWAPFNQLRWTPQ